MSEMNPLPVAESRGDNTIVKLSAVLTPQQRVKAAVTLHNKNDRPSLALVLTDAKGMELARSFIINCIDQKIEFTLHIRQPQPSFPLTLRCESFLQDDTPINSKEISIKK